MIDHKNTREQKLQRIIESEKILNEIQDVDVLLERLLTEARSIVHADAGSIYVCENDNLKIKYTQNDTQERNLAPGQKIPYSYFSFPVNEKSISGYCVVTGNLVNVKDVYAIPKDKPYKFNSQPDLLTGYKTHSMLSIPLRTAAGQTLGVLQIINPLDEDGNPICFDEDSELYLKHFAASATQALERTYLTRGMIMRLVKMAGLRDPKETSHHVQRVSRFAVEIYDAWATKHGIPIEEQNKYRDSLSIAAMLHDCGKVGISDTILKKPARFTPEEHDVIKMHCGVGAKLFYPYQSLLDEMVLEVVLHHHERWDGTGYPGIIDIENANDEDLDSMIHGKPIKKEEIPLSARIVALADVFDALSSKRAYKEVWSEAEVLNEIQESAGKHFDPDIVMAFFEVLPTLRGIQASFVDV